MLSSCRCSSQSSGLLLLANQLRHTPIDIPCSERLDELRTADLIMASDELHQALTAPHHASGTNKKMRSTPYHPPYRRVDAKRSVSLADERPPRPFIRQQVEVDGIIAAAGATKRQGLLDIVLDNEIDNPFLEARWRSLGCLDSKRAIDESAKPGSEPVH